MRFSITYYEKPSAVPLYKASAYLATFALISLGIKDHFPGGSFNAILFILIVLWLGYTILLWMQLVPQYIWHPIPGDVRRNGKFLQSLSQKQASSAQETISEETSEQFDPGDDDLPDEENDFANSCHVELRDQIQWFNLLLVSACVAINTALMVLLD